MKLGAALKENGYYQEEPFTASKVDFIVLEISKTFQNSNGM